MSLFVTQTITGIFQEIPCAKHIHSYMILAFRVTVKDVINKDFS